MKNMLMIILVFVSFSLFSNAENINECKTDIYYGNGVWNEYEDAEKSKDRLEGVIEREIIRYELPLQKKYGKLKLAYNWGQGTLLDVLETYYQLREAGQLDGIGFYTAIAALTAELPHITLGAIATQKLMEKYTKDWEQGNVDEMWNYHYYPESFKLGHRVLLVSHSQGNLFANRIYDTINPTGYKRYFANVQVASPASEVKADEVGKGSYVTLFGDPVINPIPGSMSGNANGSPGHAFVEAYLAQKDPYDKIVSRIKAVLPTVDVELTQWDTEGEPSNKGTCEEKIKVKHSFDLAVDMPFDVYPFNLSKKLYQVNGEWVKASCGGSNILDQWDGKKDNECLMIDNVEKEKIAKKENFVYWCYRRVSLDYSTQRIDYAAYEARQSLSCAYRSENIIIRDNIIPPSISSYGGGRMSALEMIESVKPLYYAMENSQEQYFQIKIDETKQKFGENFSIKKYYYQNNPFCRIILDTQYDTIVDCYDTSYLEIMFN